METLYETSATATEVFRTFDEGEPDLVKTGLGVVDRAIGGLFPGSSVILGAATGVGKTSIILHSAFRAVKHHPVLILSLEDGPDVLGARALSEVSGVDSLKIRKKNLSPKELKQLQQAQERLKGLPIQVAYPRTLEDIQQEIRGAREHRVRMVYVDYIQKWRSGSENRRNDVGLFFTSVQQVAGECGMATFFTSQFPRKDPDQVPQIWWLKESGDLENEARVVVLAHRAREEGKPPHLWPVIGRIAKSSFGGEGVSFVMRRDASGVLREEDPFQGFDEF